MIQTKLQLVWEYVSSAEKLLFTNHLHPIWENMSNFALNTGKKYQNQKCKADSDI